MIIIWNEDFKVLNIVNYFWQTIFNYNWKKYNLKTLDDAINYSEKIDNNKLNKNIQSGNQINQKLEEIKNKPVKKIIKINKKNEFYAMTVQEAVEAGFRRAYRYFGG